MDRKMSKCISTEYVVCSSGTEICRETSLNKALEVAREIASTGVSVSSVLIRDTYTVDSIYKEFYPFRINQMAPN